MNKLLVATLVPVGVAIFALGCAANRQYRTGFNPGHDYLPGPDPTNAVIEALPGEYTLGFAEFDDQGWFWSARQKRAVTDMIRHDTGMDGGAKPSGAIIMLFVHGWKNNAAYDNGNVATFRTVLKQLSDEEKEACTNANDLPRSVIGIYAGWRGLSETMEPFKELSFWARKNAAQRVGGYGAMTELITDLERLQSSNNASLPDGARQTKLIIVGHSFGADAVYNAVSQIITARFVDTINGRPGGVLKPVGDQVILLNPAFEASRMYDLKQLALSAREQYSTNQRPVLSIFQSEGDWATHYAFPAGQMVGTLFQSCRSGFQQRAIHETAGWFGPFVTHKLEYDTNAAAALNRGRPDAPAIAYTLRRPGKLPAAVANIARQREIWREGIFETNVFGNCILKAVKPYVLHNPILVVSVDKQIMSGHDDIANPVLINFLQEYIPFCDDASVIKNDRDKGK